VGISSDITVVRVETALALGAGSLSVLAHSGGEMTCLNGDKVAQLPPSAECRLFFKQAETWQRRAAGRGGGATGWKLALAVEARRVIEEDGGRGACKLQLFTHV
jgi:hypothetical protein